MTSGSRILNIIYVVHYISCVHVFCTLHLIRLVFEYEPLCCVTNCTVCCFKNVSILLTYGLHLNDSCSQTRIWWTEVLNCFLMSFVKFWIHFWMNANDGNFSEQLRFGPSYFNVHALELSIIFECRFWKWVLHACWVIYVSIWKLNSSILNHSCLSILSNFHCFLLNSLENQQNFLVCMIHLKRVGFQLVRATAVY